MLVCRRVPSARGAWSRRLFKVCPLCQIAPTENSADLVLANDVSDWAGVLVRTRHDLGLTQARLAEHIGAASKAVIYQWESGKRKPSPMFWRRIQELIE